MKKCKWKDGTFNPCDNFNGIIYWRGSGKGKEYVCSVCCNDIRKPEPPEPLIVKSGKTFVAHNDGVDYLCTDPEQFKKCAAIETLIFTDSSNMKRWKPFTEIEKEGLTDEIANLRPMVKMTATNNMKKIYKLIYVPENSCVVENELTGGLYWKGQDQVRLATPHELQANK